MLGPFYVPGSQPRAFDESMVAEAGAGIPARVYGRVLDLDGEPIPGRSSTCGRTEPTCSTRSSAPEAPEDHLRGRYRTRDDGSYAFVAVRPVPYPIPDDGPVGHMLAAAGRHPWRPAHIHMIIRAPGFRTVTTHIFDAASEYLQSDTVFAVKPSLVREFERRRPGDPQRPAGIDGEWFSLESDIVLAPGGDHGDVVDPGRTA